MIDASAPACPGLAPWAVRIAAQAPSLTPQQIARARAVFASAQLPAVIGRAA